ncbi:DegV family protein [Cytobacillus sp. S13-E01]|uniref:DegV family protein n=1 Tax=Cytobacillus sp. S13-E01 TaxID=3031326 RepID=UPI0023D873FA|nr:DegV family protein [Cytobacillus sp. S13-E01]MDF0726987.1 DegV family protein [Cytobacillus sp. S13-E01]
MHIKILTDSASDLPLHFYKDNDVTMFPLVVQLDGQDYEDLIGIQPAQVFVAMKEGKTPKTSQVSPHHFKEVFTKLAQDKIPAIYIAFSSELSGTYQTSIMIKAEVEEEYPDLDLTIIDTKCASLGFGMVVRAAAELSGKGASKTDIIEAITFNSTHMEHIFTVDDLEYLARGGRVSKASAFVGGLLNIKPLLHVEDGKLIPLEKIRGKKKVMKRIIEIIGERGKDLKNQTIAISHADNEETVLELQEQLKEKFGCESFFVNTIGATIGAHAGPGTIAIFFLNETN